MRDRKIAAPAICHHVVAPFVLAVFSSFVMHILLLHNLFPSFTHINEPEKQTFLVELVPKKSYSANKTVPQIQKSAQDIPNTLQPSVRVEQQETSKDRWNKLSPLPLSRPSTNTFGKLTGHMQPSEIQDTQQLETKFQEFRTISVSGIDVSTPSQLSLRSPYEPRTVRDIASPNKLIRTRLPSLLHSDSPQTLPLLHRNIFLPPQRAMGISDLSTLKVSKIQRVKELIPLVRKEKREITNFSNLRISPNKIAIEPHPPSLEKRIPYQTLANNDGSYKGLPYTTPARYRDSDLANHPPTYPLFARHNGLEGKVVVFVSVTKEGQANNTKIVKSSGVKSLDAAALQAVEHWNFVPAQEKGIPIDSTLMIPITFQLTN